MCAAQQPKAALVELYDSHDETLYSQLAFLKSGGYATTLMISDRKQEAIEDYLTDEQRFFTYCTGKKGWAWWKELRRIRNYIIKEKFDLVIFNTAHGNTIRNLCLMPFPKSIQFFGTLHGVNKLVGSVTQKLISTRVKNYFLLSHYMQDKAMRLPHEGLRFAVFYPMFHPDFPKVDVPIKPANELWIAIPGAVEFKRRDYTSLLQSFASLPEKPKLKFVVLGNGNHKEGNGIEVQEMVKTLGVEQHFIFFHSFVNNPTFHSYLQACDAVLPLIHPINADMEKYLENQISGSYNLAFCYHLPLLLHDYFSRYQEDFGDCALFYNLENMSKLLETLPQKLQQGIRPFYTTPKWTFEQQARQYLDFLRLRLVEFV